MAKRPRVGLVLGAGGITGGSFHAGTIAALADIGWDARSADRIVGTSAGAVVGGLLRAGVPPVDLVNRVTTAPLTPDGAKLLGHLASTPDPPQLRGFRLPRVSVVAVAAAAGRRGTINPFAIAAAAMPEGLARNDYPAQLMDSVIGAGWPDGELSIVAVRQRDGQRAVFGPADDPRPSVGQAVAASAAVPGLFRPVVIDGQAYIDGGVWSVHNVDQIDPADTDIVIVSAPMARARRTPPPRAELGLAAGIRVQLEREVARLRRAGLTVIVLAPTDDDRSVMGPNPMDPARRAPVATHLRASMSKRLADDRLARLIDPLVGSS